MKVRFCKELLNWTGLKVRTEVLKEMQYGTQRAKTMTTARLRSAVSKYGFNNLTCFLFLYPQNNSGLVKRLSRIPQTHVIPEREDQLHGRPTSITCHGKGEQTCITVHAHTSD